MFKPAGIAFIFLSAAVWGQQDSLVHERKLHKTAVGFEVGGNSLASIIGITGTFYPQPDLALDAGIGASIAGFRPGVRVRYLFLPEKFSPLIYASFKYGFTYGNRIHEMVDPGNGAHMLGLKIQSAPFSDMGAGAHYMFDNGFYLMATLGWSSRLGRKNYEWVTDPASGYSAPTATAENQTRRLYGSGPGAALTGGYAF